MALTSLPAWIVRALPAPGRAAIDALTGITAEDWRALAEAFPGLPSGIGRRAARARRELHRRSARALATGRWPARLEGGSLSSEPTVYVTAHFGALRALRYTLRARGVPAANVVGPYNLERSEGERQDGLFDRRHPLDFPHVFSAARVHRLRSALRSGSLIMAADLPTARSSESPLLGGRVQLDPRPFRLARSAGVPCRAVFLTLPERGWTLTLGPELPAAEPNALASFSLLYASVALRAPWDLDGVVYRGLTRGLR